MKYIFTTAIEVTERVLKNQSIERQNKIIEQQKEQLELQNIELELQNTQLINVMESLSEGVMVADNKGKYIMINSEAKRLFYQPDQVIVLGDTFKNTKYFERK